MSTENEPEGARLTKKQQREQERKAEEAANTKKIKHSRNLANIMTYGSAAMASGVSLSLMWPVVSDVVSRVSLLHHHPNVQNAVAVGILGFLEWAMIASATRARANVRQFGKAGVDGTAMWVIVAVSSVLAVSQAGDSSTVILAIFTPAVAAWGWERGLAPERREHGARQAVHWRLSVRRVAIALRLAEPEEADLIERARSRRLGAVATHIVRARSRWGIFKWVPKVRARRALIRAANTGAFTSTQPISLLDHIGLRAAVDELVQQTPTVPMRMFGAQEEPGTPDPESPTAPITMSTPSPVARGPESVAPAPSEDRHTGQSIVTLHVAPPVAPGVATLAADVAPAEKITVPDDEELFRIIGRLYVETDQPRSQRRVLAAFRMTHQAEEARLRAAYKRVKASDPNAVMDDMDDAESAAD